LELIDKSSNNVSNRHITICNCHFQQQSIAWIAAKPYVPLIADFGSSQMLEVRSIISWPGQAMLLNGTSLTDCVT